MDKAKQAQFVRKMGKKRLKLTKREHFDGGGIAGLLGSAGGLGGTGFNTSLGTTGTQINNAYNQNQAALASQGALANTLTPQASNAVAAQNTLSNQFAQQAQGAGPNVAVNELNQATGANVANQAALMAGQRGASANPALLARQAAMQGAATQQQSAGQAATLQAQQQIAAQQAQAQLAANQIAQTQGATTAATQAQQGEQGILQGANTANNNLQGQLANTTLQGQQGLIGGVMNGIGGAIGLSEGGEVGAKKLDFVHKMTKMGLEHHSKSVMMADGGATPSPTPSQSHFGISGANASQPPTIVPAAAKSVQDSFRGATGYADGGLTVPQVTMNQQQQTPFTPVQQVEGGFNPGTNTGAQALGNSMQHHEKKPTSLDQQNKNIPAEGQSVLGANPQTIGPIGSTDAFSGIIRAAHGGEIRSHFENYFANGGAVPAMVSPGEIYLTPDQVHKVIHEDVDPAKMASRFSGKAKFKGDSKKNDTIPTTLEQGGVVIDREHMGSPEKRKLFVHRAIAKKKAGTR